MQQCLMFHNQTSAKEKLRIRGREPGMKRTGGGRFGPLSPTQKETLLEVIFPPSGASSSVVTAEIELACVAGVKSGRGNLGAQERLGRALIPFPFSFERLPRRLRLNQTKTINFLFR